MKKLFIILAVFVIEVVQASAAGTNAVALLKISAAEATNYYDREMIVTGTVAQVTIRSSVTFLNLDEKYPESPLAVVIIHGKSSYYGDANSLKGKSIEIRGKVIKYKDKPEIALDATNQLVVLDITNSVPKAKRKPKAPAVPLANPAPAVEPSTNDFPEIM